MCTVIEMQVTAADGAARHLEDDIAVVEDLGLGRLDCLLLDASLHSRSWHLTDFDFALARPGKRFHRHVGVADLDVVGDILLQDGIVVLADRLVEPVCCL